MECGRHRRVGLEVEAPLHNSLNGVDRARAAARIADESRVDVARHGIAESERVRRHEKGAHEDRDDRDQDRAFDGRPPVHTQGGERPRHATTSTGVTPAIVPETAGGDNDPPRRRSRRGRRGAPSAAAGRSRRRPVAELVHRCGLERASEVLNRWSARGRAATASSDQETAGGAPLVPIPTPCGLRLARECYQESRGRLPGWAGTPRRRRSSQEDASKSRAAHFSRRVPRVSISS